MAIIIHPKRWTQQPPIGAQIDFGHPLAKGLTFYTLFNSGAGPQKALLPAGLPGTPVGTVPGQEWVSGPGGKSHNFNVNWSVWYERGPWVEPATNQFTVLTRLRRVSTAGGPINKTYNNGGSSPFTSYAIEWNPGGAGQDAFRADVSTGGSLHTGTTVSLTSGSTLNATTIGLTYTSGSLRAYANGLKKTDDNITGTVSYDTSSTGRFIVAGSSAAAASNPWHGQIYFAAVWNRVLLPSEMEWLHIEPYAMLIPTKRKKFFLATGRSFTFYISAEKII